jgi:hypothetical protein
MYSIWQKIAIYIETCSLSYNQFLEPVWREITSEDMENISLCIFRPYLTVYYNNRNKQR